MKKVVSLAVAAATLVGSAVADITFGSWGRGNWVVAANQKQNDKHDKDSEVGEQHVIMGAAQSWGQYSPRTALSVNGNSEKVGFALDMFANGGNGIEVGDNAYVWAKPIDQVKIELGKMDNNILRSNACFGMFDQLRVGNVDGNQEGWTFGGQGTSGAIIEVTPIENLIFVASLGFNLNNGSWDKGSDKNIEGTNWGTVFGRQSKYCLGYTIPETATIKLGLFEGNNYVTKNKDGDKAWQNYIQVAADITAVENLFLTVGLNIPTVIQNKENEGDVVKFNGYASYKASDELTAHFRFGTKFCALDKKDTTDVKDGKVGFLVGAGVDYQISDTLSAYAELDYANNIYCNQSTADNMDCFDFGFGVFESLGGNGKIGIGFAGATNNKGLFYVEGEDAEKTAKAFSWAVPVTIQYCF